jgi:phosphoglycerate dehydrogenase-like enzyme
VYYYFINVGRGPSSVDEEALIETLKDNSGGLSGTGLDVFATEPLPLDSEVWKLDNVLLGVSPHNMYQQEILQDEGDFFRCG